MRVPEHVCEAYRMLAAYSAKKADLSALEGFASEIIALRMCRRAIRPEGRRADGARAVCRRRQDARRGHPTRPASRRRLSANGEPDFLAAEVSQAESWYRRALEHDKTSTDSLRGLINIYLTQKQPDKALAAVNQQIAQAPDNSSFYDLLGMVQTNKQDYGSAIAAVIRRPWT